MLKTKPFDLKTIIIFNVILAIILFLCCGFISFSKKPIIYCFSSVWCSASRDLCPKIKQINKTYSNKVILNNIDIDCDEYQFKKSNVPFYPKKTPAIIVVHKKKIMKEIYYKDQNYDELKKEIDSVVLPIIKN